MKSTFTIDGMTCSGCAAKVTYTLQQIDSVSGVDVDLYAKQAILTAERSIDLTEVAAELAPHPKYSVRPVPPMRRHPTSNPFIGGRIGRSF